MALRNFLFGLFASSALAGRCDVFMDGIEALSASHSVKFYARQSYPIPPPIDLVVHVVAGSSRREDGYLTPGEVAAQVTTIQTLFALNTSLTFSHDPTTMVRWTINPDWAGSSTSFNEMKESLHIGDYKTLNLYIRNITVDNYGGTCTHPWRMQRDYPTDKERRLILDGCVVNTLSLPGSSHPFMNQGKTAVHEIGHWLGLWHPWEAGDIRNGVNPPNPCWEGNPDDGVADTPKMRSMREGTCNRTANTCPEPAGMEPIYDPVTNIMGYGSDECMEILFTEGQVARMYEYYDIYRKTGVPI